MNVLKIGAGLLAGASLLATAQASPIGSYTTPVIVAGAPADVDGAGTADSPAARVDPNTSASPWSGVVSINIRYDGQSYICTGALIDRTHVLSAGHCVDTTGNGDVIDVSQSYAASGKDVRVVFNSDGTFNDLITASDVTMHQDYEGFGNCPVGVPGFCVNDDIAIIELSEPAPASAKIYSIFGGEVAEGSEFTMVGYGRSGDGWNGYTVNPNFFVKRDGTNNYDMFETDDESFTGFDGNGFINGAGAKEVWYADFDGTDPAGAPIDTFCTYFGVCSGDAGNLSETMLGGGDSGGPSFMWNNGQYYLVANNTFSGNLFQSPAGRFGDYSGGILLHSYGKWIWNTVPEPGTVALMLAGLGGLAVARRRKAKA